MNPRLRRAALPAILVLALVLRIGAMVATDPYLPQWDAVDYHAHALALVHEHQYPGTLFAGLDVIEVPSATQPPTIPERTQGPSAFRPPTYPYFLAAVYAVSGDSWTAGRLASALLGVIAVLLVFLVARLLWDRTVALVAALIAAVAPSLVYLNAALMSEPLFIVFELGAVLAVLLYGRGEGRMWWALAAGVLCGLCSLTRANGVVLVLACAIGVWIFARRAGRGSVAPTVALLLAAALTILPWTIRNALVMDQVVPISTQAGLAIAGSYNRPAEQGGLKQGWIQPLAVPVFQREVFRNPRLNEAGVERELRRRGLEYALDHPGYALGTTWWNSLRMFELADLGRYREVFQDERGLGEADRDASRIGAYVLGLLALAGVVALFLVPRERRGELFIWLIPLLLFASTVPLNGSPRYRAPIDPWLVLLAALAVVEGGRLVMSRRQPVSAGSAATGSGRNAPARRAAGRARRNARQVEPQAEESHRHGG